ncbi:MAG: RusA family crossover junction endodeoxyribonuclease [Clostridia bacterium]|nr:RusA family crossover junction endodeoxyribonuclease [Clostridia bacterium]MBR5984827.1 RusA family crossover junction endodeoxyribonuclease [Clostridia bacterium]
MEFYLDMNPPTVTAQEHKVRVNRGRPMFYNTARLKQAQAVFESMLMRYMPGQPMEGPVALTVDWFFFTGSHKDGEWRVTRPDTDNLQKLLKDCMTRTGFWKDDSQVCVEMISKRWARRKPGIGIKVVSLVDE